MFRIAVRSLRIFNSLKQENFSKINPCCTSNLVTVFYNSNNNKRYFSDKKDTGKPDANHFDDEERTEEQQSYDLITSKYFKYDKNEENKRSFEGAIDIFTHKDGRRRGDVEFIYGALRNMERFGVHRDLASYKKLFNVFPKGKYVPENRLQADFFHYPRQQECALVLISAMNKNQLIPDEEFGHMILNTFGKISRPFQKYCRLMYWGPKLKNISPWLLPEVLPDDALELAKMGIKQITSVDRLTEIKVYDPQDLEQESTDKTWIVSGQSPDQSALLKDLEKGTPVYVEGAFRVWLKEVQVNYFILRGAPRPQLTEPQVEEIEFEHIRLWMDGVKEKKEELKVNRYPTIHEQEDGTIYAVCATGTSSRESLLSWIRFLEKENPVLKNLAVLFTLQSPLGPVIPIKNTSEIKQN